MTTLSEARRITRQIAPANAKLGEQAYENDTYWLVPVYKPMEDVAPDEAVPVVRIPQRRSGSAAGRLPRRASRSCCQ